MRRKITIALVMIALGMASEPALAGFADLCQEELRYRLQSSAIEIKAGAESSMPLSADQWTTLVEAEASDAHTPAVIHFMAQQIEAGSIQPVLFFQELEFGAPSGVASAALCTYLDDHGDLSQAAWYTIRLDGWTRNDWLADQASRR